MGLHKPKSRKDVYLRLAIVVYHHVLLTIERSVAADLHGINWILAFQLIVP